MASNHPLLFILAAPIPNPSPNLQFLPLALTAPYTPFPFTTINTSLILSWTYSKAVSGSPLPLLMSASPRPLQPAPTALFTLNAPTLHPNGKSCFAHICLCFSPPHTCSHWSLFLESPLPPPPSPNLCRSKSLFDLCIRRCSKTLFIIVTKMETLNI